MQPLINLRRFVAVLVLLIIPAALLTAYFRNFQPEADGRQSGGASGHHATSAASGGDGPGEMDHSKMSGTVGSQAAQPALDAKQLEASRAQLEASRLQLEASRMALEAANLPPLQVEKEATAEGADAAPSQAPVAKGHEH